MRYDLECRECETVSEHEIPMDQDMEVACPNCQATMTRHGNLVFSVPYVIGVQCPGSKVPNYNGYYDHGLDTWITSKQHRSEEMKRQGVVEYAPDPYYAKQREDMRYIRRNSNPGDPEAAKTIRKIAKAADTKRRTDTVNASMKKAFDAVKEGG